ncbi:hypothetical protein M0804_004884 [Polistes exclamans]|nr:hypothetical protein M0804_004884 [Polistes exclamans]
MRRVHQQTLFGELDFDKHSIRYGCGWGRQHRLSGGPLVSRGIPTSHCFNEKEEEKEEEEEENDEYTFLRTTTLQIKKRKRTKYRKRKKNETATATAVASFNWRTLRKCALLMMLMGVMVEVVVVVENSSSRVREVGQSSLKADCLKKQYRHPFYLILALSFTMQRWCNDIHIESCTKRQGCHLVIQPASQPASQPTRQPASKPTSKPASQPVIQAASLTIPAVCLDTLLLYYTLRTCTPVPSHRCIAVTTTTIT